MALSCMALLEGGSVVGSWERRRLKEKHRYYTI